MKIALLGSRGQLGRALEGTLACIARVTAFDRAALDLNDLETLRGALRSARPDLVVNAAAYTDSSRPNPISLYTSKNAPMIAH